MGRSQNYGRLWGSGHSRTTNSGKGHSTGGDRSFKAREMLPSRQRHQNCNPWEENICGYTAEGTKLGIDVQIAEVKKTLGSVRRICEAGNRVVFDEDGSYVENKSSGEKTALTKERARTCSPCGCLGNQTPSNRSGLFRGRENEPRSALSCKTREQGHWGRTG